MPAPVSSVDAVELFDALAAELGDPAIGRGRMMGRLTLTRAGTMFACLNGDELGLKLGVGTPELASALALPGAELFDPSGKGRPFRGWVSLPLDASAHWMPVATDALTFIAAEA